MASAAVTNMAIRVGNAVGFDPTVLVTIITAIIGILQNCKKPANKSVAGSMIDDEFATLAKGKRADKCPLQFRKAFKQNDVFDREEQNELWAAMVADAKANKSAVSAAMVA